MEAEQGKSQLRQAGLQIVSGGVAGFVEICLMHPLDIAKTRLQMQVTGSALNQYKGVGDCFAKMYKHEGLFSYWKGILPPILVETPKTAVRFFTFEQSKRFFLFGESKPTPLVIIFGWRIRILAVALLYLFFCPDLFLGGFHGRDSGSVFGKSF